MSSGLTPYTEHLIEKAIATGLFPSREAVIEAGVARLMNEPKQVPPEHLEAILEGFDDLDHGRSRPMASDDWARLRQIAYDAAAGKRRSG